MKKRAKKLNANLGQRHLECLLEHQDLIQKEWRKYYLTFPGTVWQDFDGRRNVPYLNYWYGDRWHLYFGLLKYHFGEDSRLVRLILRV